MIKGRGVSDNPAGRFQRIRVEHDEGCMPPSQVTEYRSETAKSLITSNDSPDVPFRHSINPYRGCEHGCSYCFARPTHSYLDLSPGLDFETRIICKDNAVSLLQETLAKDSYRCEPVVIGSATDPYQPVEKTRRLTRGLLEVFLAHHHPVGLITKSGLIRRDLDLLAALAGQQLVSVAVSVTTLDNALKARLEPRASNGSTRLAVIRELSAAGVPVTVLFAPVIPFINDDELEEVIAQAAEAGAQRAGYVMLRLPWEVNELWRGWLAEHYPERAQRVMSVVRELHGGRDYQSDWHQRQTGRGQWANLFARRFELACRRAGLEGNELPPLRTDLFRVPTKPDQLVLW
ncbi:MAG: PA0069 family radical SAM protein [Alcanivoracaceae bacterium]